MNRGTIERDLAAEPIVAEEHNTLREIQLIRDQQEMEGLNDRILQYEESGGIRIVSYNDYVKETVYRDSEGKERIDIDEITVDEKNELDAMYGIVEEYEQEDTSMDDVDILDELEEEKDIDDGFERDVIDRDDDMEYE